MIRFIKQEMPRVNDMVKQQCYYKVDTIGNMSQDELIEQMSLCGMSKAHIEMVLTRMKESIVELLRQGYSVSIDGLGRFSLSIGVKDDKEVEKLDGGEKRNAASIKVRNVLFAADKKIVKELNRKCRFERGGTCRLTKCKFTKEQRLDMARAFIAKHQLMRINEYMNITGLKKTAASQELRQFAESPSITGITTVGRGSSLVYVAMK
ncbi:MAG: HU family DNA-binding protein [Bacteroidaceae bacterium]|nr:HU family DNA-binding protein [Bacteroidaceae bacterium]